ncbi:hypothetical protein SLAVM298S_00002 [Streptomyces lavendulae subsp. lavendulae]
MGSADFWVRHVREAVRFLDGIRALEAAGVTTYLELGPDGTLSALAHDCVTDRAAAAFAPTLRADRPEAQTLATALARAHVRGAAVDWHAHFAPARARRVDLPTYPFQRERYWPEPGTPLPADATGLGLAAAGHPLLGAAVSLADATAASSPAASRCAPTPGSRTTPSRAPSWSPARPSSSWPCTPESGSRPRPSKS